MTDNRYLWRPDPKGEDIPQTLFGLPVYMTVLEDEPKDFVIVLGTLDEYMTRRPITREELHRLLAGKAVFIKDIEEGEMTDPHYENPYDLSEGRKGFKLAATDGGQLLKDLLMKANRLEIEAAAYKNQRESLQRELNAAERERDQWHEMVAAWKGSAETAERELDAARKVLRKVAWVPHATSAGVLWKCEVCHGWKDDGHNDDCELKAALGGPMMNTGRRDDDQIGGGAR